ncbi:cbb3-type cytochrome oxidase subunit 3 [Oleisolibacter albus]|uniref:cbb3-type cytochrome oxidase subunit 3 n=1 Tax=Oleisolibacter albus TaxID=2171757 RepID=UPI000DF448EA|nr:cbb3-type cytochrome c oxidase subunit 3 [Oleisolibacter albus]
MSELYPLLQQIWIVWFVVLFSGIVVWAFWPTRRRRLEDQGNIPLRDGPPSGAERAR